jgi:hypothetical protein
MPRAEGVRRSGADLPVPVRIPAAPADLGSPLHPAAHRAPRSGRPRPRDLLDGRLDAARRLLDGDVQIGGEPGDAMERHRLGAEDVPAKVQLLEDGREISKRPTDRRCHRPAPVVVSAERVPRGPASADVEPLPHLHGEGHALAAPRRDETSRARSACFEPRRIGAEPGPSSRDLPGDARPWESPAQYPQPVAPGPGPASPEALSAGKRTRGDPHRHLRGGSRVIPPSCSQPGWRSSGPLAARR